ncbi:unnamed protein product [Diamesa hyperborea]
MNISLHNTSNDEVILLDNKNVVIGRDFFKSDDKRIARNLGEITVLDTEIKIRSVSFFFQCVSQFNLFNSFNFVKTHTNPIFYQKDQSEFQILQQNEEIVLGHGHSFSLIRNAHIYKILVTDENLAGNPETLTTSSANEIIDDKNDSPRSSNRSTPDLDIPQHSSSCSGVKRSADEDPNECTNKKPKNNDDAVVDQDINQPSNDLNVTNPDVQADQDINQTSNVLPLIKPDPDGAAGPSSNQPFNVMPIIKPDPDGEAASSTNKPFNVMPIIKPDPDGPSCSTNSTSATTVKTEPASTDSPTPSPSSPVTPTTRAVCQFGIKCYRHNSEHRTLLAHPGDADYRRPDFLPAPDTAPDCEYGASCYRRNPQHFSEFQHLPPNAYQSPQRTNIILIAQRQRNIDNNIQIARANRPDRGLIVDYEDDDDLGSDQDFDASDLDDEEYQRGRHDMTSSDDEENNCEE